MEIISTESKIISPIDKTRLVEIFPEEHLYIEEIEDEYLVIYEEIRKTVTAREPIQAIEIVNQIGINFVKVGRVLRTFWQLGYVRMFLDPGPHRNRVRLGKEVAYYLIHNIHGYKIEYKHQRSRAKSLNLEQIKWIRENQNRLPIIEMARQLNTSEWYIKKAL